MLCYRLYSCAVVIVLLLFVFVLLLFVLFYLLKLCVLQHCHRVLTQLQSSNIYIYILIMIINGTYQNQNLLSLQLVSFLVGLRTYQHPCTYITQHKQDYNFDHRLINVQSLFQDNRDTLAHCFRTCSFICSTNSTSKYRANIRMKFDVILTVHRR